MIWRPRNIVKKIKMNQHRYHYESFCLPKNENGTRLKSSNFKNQYPEVTSLDYFIIHKKKGGILSGHDLRKIILPYTSVHFF